MDLLSWTKAELLLHPLLATQPHIQHYRFILLHRPNGTNELNARLVALYYYRCHRHLRPFIMNAISRVVIVASVVSWREIRGARIATPLRPFSRMLEIALGNRATAHDDDDDNYIWWRRRDAPTLKWRVTKTWSVALGVIQLWNCIILSREFSLSDARPWWCNRVLHIANGATSI